MGEVVNFTKKKRKRLRPNKRAGRGSAEVKIFPVLRSRDRQYLDSAVLDVAAGASTVSSVLTEIYEAGYWEIPREVLKRDFSFVGWYLHHRANRIRRACGRPELELPTKSRRSMKPSQQPPPSAA